MGHPARDCTKQAKGKGKGTGKGWWSSGKGVWQVDGEEGDWSWNQPEEEDQKEIGSIGAAEEWIKVPSRSQQLEAVLLKHGVYSESLMDDIKKTVW